MGYPAYLIANLVEDGTLSSSTEDADYPLENLFDQILAKPFKAVSTTTAYIEVDHGSAVPYDTVAVLNHNLTAAGTAVVTGGAGAAPASVIGASTYRANDIWWNVGSRNERYTRITLADANTRNLYVGELVVGLRTALPRASRWGRQQGLEETDLEHETNRGVKWPYKLVSREIREYVFRFPESEFAAFKLLHQTLQGQLRPFLYIPNVALTEALYVRKEPSFRPQSNDAPGMDGSLLATWYDYTLTLTEESRGVEILA